MVGVGLARRVDQLTGARSLRQAAKAAGLSVDASTLDLIASLAAELL